MSGVSVAERDGGRRAMRNVITVARCRGRACPACPRRRSARRRSPRRGRPAAAPPPCSGWSAGSSCRARAGRRSAPTTARRAAGSKPVVGSSRNSSSGSPAIAEREVEAAPLAAGERADARVALLARGPTSSITSSTGSGLGVARRVELDRLAHGEVRLDGRLLQHDADALAEARAARGRGRGRARRTSPRVARAVALEDLDDRGLAGAVGAEQGDDLAAARTSRSTPRTASTRRRSCATHWP